MKHRSAERLDKLRRLYKDDFENATPNFNFTRLCFEKVIADITRLTLYAI